jgi:hypothetical protein
MNVTWVITFIMKCIYLLPHLGIEFFKKIPIYSLPAAWNAAGNLRFYQNRTTFKIALKDPLLAELETDID